MCDNTLGTRMEADDGSCENESAELCGALKEVTTVDSLCMVYGLWSNRGGGYEWMDV